MSDPATIDVWMIEVLGDGIGQRHRRYLVAAHHREAAIVALCHHTGMDPLITSRTKFEGEAAVCEMKLGHVRPI
jgi:hypothetical protein